MLRHGHIPIPRREERRERRGEERKEILYIPYDVVGG